MLIPFQPMNFSLIDVNVKLMLNGILLLISVNVLKGSNSIQTPKIVFQMK